MLLDFCRTPSKFHNLICKRISRDKYFHYMSLKWNEKAFTFCPFSDDDIFFDCMENTVHPKQALLKSFIMLWKLLCWCTILLHARFSLGLSNIPILHSFLSRNRCPWMTFNDLYFRLKVLSLRILLLLIIALQHTASLFIWHLRHAASTSIFLFLSFQVDAFATQEQLLQ